MKRFTIGLTNLLAVCLVAAPGIVQAKTGTADAINAARVQELSMLLNSVALRCNAIGINLQAEYGRFLERQKSGLTRAESTLREHYDVRTKADLHGEIDRFRVRVLNFYGTGRTDRQSCGTNANVLNMLSQADDSGVMLTRIAEVMVPSPLFGDGS